MIPACPRCHRPTHASESNDAGVCAECLGSNAILPDAGESTITRAERALLVEIERGGMHGSVCMRGLNKAARGLIAKDLGYSIGRIGGGYYVHSTVRGSAYLGIDWDNGPRPTYDERKGKYVIVPDAGESTTHDVCVACGTIVEIATMHDAGTPERPERVCSSCA